MYIFHLFFQVAKGEYSLFFIEKMYFSQALY